MNAEARQIQGRLANHKRNHGADATYRSLRREFLTARLAEQIEETLAEERLTISQRQRLVALLLVDEVAA